MYQKSIDIASLVDVYKIIEAVKFDDGKYDTVVIFKNGNDLYTKKNNKKNRDYIFLNTQKLCVESKSLKIELLQYIFDV